MTSKILAAAGISLLFAVPALAQPTKSVANESPSASSSNSSGSGNSQPNGMSIRQDIMQNLQKAGYKNVQLAPASFVAHATDPHGNPVVMAISPDSMTVITAVNTPGQSGSHQMASNGNDNNSAGSTTGGAKNGH